jgi:XTP/dITP diphosphohydrolase
MPAILIATRNAHKVSEIQAILGKQFNYLTLDDFAGFSDLPKVVEDAGTFAGNATKKAVELANWLKSAQYVYDDVEHQFPFRRGKLVHLLQPPLQTREKFVLADDSGLEVDALNGAPGVFSARFAALDSGENSPDADNNAKLLRLLKDIPLEKRTARFRCVIALTPIPSKAIESASPVCYADESGFQTQLFDGACEGRIIFEPSGANGFGYDPLFVPDGFDQTFADLGDDIKNKLSHRAQALGKLKKTLDSQS